MTISAILIQSVLRCTSISTDIKPISTDIKPEYQLISHSKLIWFIISW